MPERLHIITPLNRLENLPRLARSVAESGLAARFAVSWWLMVNREDVPPALAGEIALPTGGEPTEEDIRVLVVKSPAWGYDARGLAAFGHAQRSHALDLIGDTDPGWVWVLDDDNLVHPDFAAGLAELMAAHPSARGFVVGQHPADSSPRPIGPEWLRPGYVDTAQYILRRDLIGAERVRQVHADDGAFIGRVYAAHPADVVFCERVLTYWNGMTLP